MDLRRFISVESLRSKLTEVAPFVTHLSDEVEVATRVDGVSQGTAVFGTQQIGTDNGWANDGAFGLVIPIWVGGQCREDQRPECPVPLGAKGARRLRTVAGSSPGAEPMASRGRQTNK